MVWFAGTALKKIGQFDISNIKNTITNITEEVWNNDPRMTTNQNFYEAATLWIRKVPETHYGFNQEFHAFDTINFNNSEFEEQCRTFQKQFETQFNGVLIRTCIIRLLPGQQVKKHVDGDENLHRYCNRLILPIITNPQVIMTCDSPNDTELPTDFVLDENIVYDTNGYVPHRTVNNGDTTRYAFILDFLSNNLEHPMKVNIYSKLDNALWQKIYNEGQKKIMPPEIKQPLIETSNAWRDLYWQQEKIIQ
jgi:hypothetical protein